VSYKSWSYIEDDEFKTTTSVVHDLIDIVSKNGNLLLNIGPKADGTICQEATDILLGLGAWLDVNGEAIYGTRHWRVFGEGPTEVSAVAFRERDYLPFTAQDVRYTVKGDVLYAICLGWPKDGVIMESLVGVKVAGVSMLGSDETISWSQGEGGLTINAPSQKPCDHAYSFKVQLEA
jgi:alpha-L-fucosidase